MRCFASHVVGSALAPPQPYVMHIVCQIEADLQHRKGMHFSPQSRELHLCACPGTVVLSPWEVRR